MSQKHCKQCGEILQRKRYGRRLEGLKDFKKRMFCSVSCSANYRERIKSGKEPEAVFPDKQPPEAAPLDKSKYKTGVEILREIANNKNLDEITRLNAAKALAPYETAKAGSLPKKEGAAERASKAAKGKFSSGRTPVLPLRRD